MLFADHVVVMRGGGDLATGAVVRLHRAGFPVVVLELDPPHAVRRSVSVASAVVDGEFIIEGVTARRVSSAASAVAHAATGVVAVLVAEDQPIPSDQIEVLVDARMAKRNLGTTISDAPLVVALGPGFVAGKDCDAVVETQRGHHLGRVLWSGSASPNTGLPGTVGGQTERRLLRAEAAGPVTWDVAIGDHVMEGAAIGCVGEVPIRPLTSGVVRGLIIDGFPARPGLKLGDVDPRADKAACFEVSDKSLAVGGGVLEAVLTHLSNAR